MELDNLFYDREEPKKPSRKKKTTIQLEWMLGDYRMVTPRQFGFVYKVIELSTGLIYVGKKNFFKPGTTTQTTWMDYKTSSTEVNRKIKANPSDWEAVVLGFANSNGELYQLEKLEQKNHSVFKSGVSYNKEYFY